MKNSTINSMSLQPFSEMLMADCWAIEESAFNGLVQGLQSDGAVPRSLMIARGEEFSVAGSLEEFLLSQMVSITADGVGVLAISGVMLKQASFFGTSTVLLRKALASLVQNSDVSQIVLHVESPGGMSAGTHQLANDVRQATSVKPVTAFVEDLGASAAYWVASQADKIYANAPARIGSIGTYMVVSDLSAQAEKVGVKVHVVKAGESKGALTPGTEVTESQLSELQARVHGTNQFFLDAVAEGRGFSAGQIAALADGRAHLAEDALKLGLIDGVQNFDSYLGQLGRTSITGAVSMANTETTETVVATIADIRAACPGISSDSLLAMAESGKSLDECKDSYLQDLVGQITALSEENSSLKTKLDAVEESASEHSTLGVDPLDHVQSSGAGDVEESATDQFNALVKEKVAKGLSKSKALQQVVSQNADLHKAYLKEINAVTRS